MAITKKKIINDIEIVLSRFGLTDDARLDSDWLSFKIDQIREQLIINQFNETKAIDYTWLSNLDAVDFHKVNFADDITVSYCDCDISKTTIPNVVTLLGEYGGNPDIGLWGVMSLCGKTKYYPFPITIWKDIPKEHVRSKFAYYHRNNTELYVNKKVEQLRIIAILSSPEDGYLINSAPVTTIAAGTVYKVKYKQIYYNSTLYAPDSTFTGVAGFTTFTGNGTVYLNSQVQSITETRAYPVSGDMARQIVLEILTKEFKIEQTEIPDILNNSVDDIKEKTTQSVQ
jgi:hypothetical protein